MSNPSVAIVILNWNGKQFLQQFIPSVLASTYPGKRVILADNASTDDSVSFIEKYHPEVEIILSAENKGFAGGYNAALKQVKADYYVLLNSDVEVAPGWIEPVIRLMESDKQIAACQPKILSYHDRSSFEYAGASGGWIDSFGYPFSRGRVFETCEKDLGQYDDAAPCFWATGAAMFVKAEIFHEMGGFDEYFFAHMEEIDLCWRMQLIGYKIFVQPLSVVYHVGGGTLQAGNPKKAFLNFRNNLIMLSKNLPLLSACWKIPFRFFLDALFAWKSLLSGEIYKFRAVLMAHFAFIYWGIFIRRSTPRPVKPSCSFGGWYHGLVIWDYFIRKKRRFSEIVELK